MFETHAMRLYNNLCLIGKISFVNPYQYVKNKFFKKGIIKFNSFRADN